MPSRHFEPAQNRERTVPTIANHIESIQLRDQQHSVVDYVPHVAYLFGRMSYGLIFCPLSL